MKNPKGDQGDLLHHWQQILRELSFTDFVSPEDGFRTSEKRGWQNCNETGLYCWVAENGEVYIGQALKVRRRLLQHWKNHKDILAASFKGVQQDLLDAEEENAIRIVQSYFPTRNIKFAINTATFVAFDEFLSPDKREEFLSSATQKKQKFIWRKLEILEQKQRKKFQNFEKSAVFSDALKAIKLFVSTCVPLPYHTENRFWSISLLDQPVTVIRINAGQQEVFTIIRDGLGNLAARTLALKKLDRDFEGPYYRTNSYSHCVSIDQFETWFNAERILACRALVVWLMRHTTTLNSGNHCPQLIRNAFA